VSQDCDDEDEDVIANDPTKVQAGVGTLYSDTGYGVSRVTDEAMWGVLEVVVAVASYAMDDEMWLEAVDVRAGLEVVDAVVGDVLVSIVPFDV
jgi:hypothetical protein